MRDDEVEQIYVAENARGGGAAKALLRHAEQEIAVRFDVGWLAVVAGNTRARRFYARNGWCDAGAFDYAAEITSGTILVPSRRYEKHITRTAPIRTACRGDGQGTGKGIADSAALIPRLQR